MKIIQTGYVSGKSYSEQECRECNKPAPFLIQIGERPDYDSFTTFICWRCLEKGYKQVQLTMAINADPKPPGVCNSRNRQPN